MKQVLTKSGETLQMNDSETEVFHFGTWKEIQEDQEGELYFMGGLQAIYLDYLTPVNTTTQQTENNRREALIWYDNLGMYPRQEILVKHGFTGEVTDEVMERMYNLEHPTTEEATPPAPVKETEAVVKDNEGELVIEKNHIVYKDKPGLIIASCNLLRGNWEETAQLIVNSVNAHNELVRALKRVVEYMKDDTLSQAGPFADAKELLSRINK